MHWYHEKGLLQPAYRAANGYRYYKEEQLLILQQILFFRELEFNLDDIQKLLAHDDFDKINALVVHKRILAEDIDRKKQLIATNDKTIAHLRGNETMENEDLYYGFDSSKQKEYEQYLVNYRGLEAEKKLFESKKKTTQWSEDEWDEVKSCGDAIHKDLAQGHRTWFRSGMC